jgi:hypothetical protein
MSIDFASPGTGGSGDTLAPADVEGHVLVVEPLEYVASITTAFGEKDAIRATVHDITTQSTAHDVLWFPGGLIGALKGRVGQRVLGVMGKGQAKAGQSAPWVLIDASGNEAAVKAATAYLTGQVAATITAPAPAAPAPVAAPSALDAALGNLAAAGVTK